MILLLDTTQSSLMLGLLKTDGQVDTLRQEHHSQRYHSSVLLPEIRKLLQQHQLRPKDLTGVAVNIGPGSFTGIRTGLTVVRMMGHYISVPTYGFNTFELIAADPAYRGHSVTVMMNAFRGRHYRAALTVDSNAQTTWLEEPTVLDNTELAELTTSYVLVEGSLESLCPFPQSDTITFFSALPMATPETMAFFLQHGADRFQTPWQSLEPLYMQQPHISKPKAKT